MAKKMTILLVDKQRKDVAKVEVEAEQIAEASMIVYKGKHYLYSGSEGRFFTQAVFMEANPPVVVG